MVFIPQAQPHAQSLFLFPIVFGINFSLVRVRGGVFQFGLGLGRDTGISVWLRLG